MINSSVVKFKGTIQFPHFEAEDVYNGRPVGYSVIIGHLSEAAVEAIEEAYGPKDFNGNQRVKFKDTLDFGQHLKLKSKFPIIPEDVDGKTFEGRTDEIGYGSECIVVTKADKSGQPRVVKLIVTKLVESEGSEGAVDLTADVL